jgi:hypothetical protein
MNNYHPKSTGKLQPLLEAMRADPNPKRLWSPSECAEVMGIKPRHICSFTAYAVQHGVIYRTVIGRTAYHSLEPGEGCQPPVRAKNRGAKAPKCKGEYVQPLDDIRIPKVVPGWMPPKMVAPREVNHA